MNTDWVCLDGLIDGFLEGLLLELHEDAIGLLSLCFPFFCSLPPKRNAQSMSCFSRTTDAPYL